MGTFKAMIQGRLGVRTQFAEIEGMITWAVKTDQLIEHIRLYIKPRIHLSLNISQ